MAYLPISVEDNLKIKCPICGLESNILTIRDYGKCGICRRKGLVKQLKPRKIVLDPYDLENDLLRKLLLSPKQLQVLALFIEKNQIKSNASLLQELTPKYLRARAAAIELFNGEE